MTRHDISHKITKVKKPEGKPLTSLPPGDTRAPDTWAQRGCWCQYSHLLSWWFMTTRRKWTQVLINFLLNQMDLLKSSLGCTFCCRGHSARQGGSSSLLGPLITTGISWPKTMHDKDKPTRAGESLFCLFKKTFKIMNSNLQPEKQIKH